jgi:hypothetical protein
MYAIYNNVLTFAWHDLIRWSHFAESLHSTDTDRQSEWPDWANFCHLCSSKLWDYETNAYICIYVARFWQPKTCEVFICLGQHFRGMDSFGCFFTKKNLVSLKIISLWTSKHAKLRTHASIISLICSRLTRLFSSRCLVNLSSDNSRVDLGVENSGSTLCFARPETMCAVL